MVLKEKLNENELLKGHTMKMEGTFRDNIGNIERAYRENMEKSKIATGESERVVVALREKCKESDELRAALMRFEGLILEKT